MQCKSIDSTRIRQRSQTHDEVEHGLAFSLATTDWVVLLTSLCIELIKRHRLLVWQWVKFMAMPNGSTFGDRRTSFPLCRGRRKRSTGRDSGAGSLQRLVRRIWRMKEFDKRNTWKFEKPVEKASNGNDENPRRDAQDKQKKRMNVSAGRNLGRNLWDSQKQRLMQ